MEIPYTVREREDTGLYNAKLGIWLFLASEVMLFGALFSAYILLRVSSPPGFWPHHVLNVPIGTVNTIVLIVSSVTVVMGWASLKMNQFGKYRIFQAITILCAMTFVGVKSYEYHDKFTHYAVMKKDGTVVDGHLISKDKEKIVLHPNEHPETRVRFLTEKADAAPTEHGATAEAAHKDGAAESHAGHHEPVTVPMSEVQKLEAYGPWHHTYLDRNRF